jgi:hypothetical protein
MDEIQSGDCLRLSRHEAVHRLSSISKGKKISTPYALNTAHGCAGARGKLKTLDELTTQLQLFLVVSKH